MRFSFIYYMLSVKIPEKMNYMYVHVARNAVAMFGHVTYTEGSAEGSTAYAGRWRRACTGSDCRGSSCLGAERPRLLESPACQGTQASCDAPQCSCSARAVAVIVLNTLSRNASRL